MNPVIFTAALLLSGQSTEARPRVEHVLFPAARGYWWRYRGNAGPEEVQVQVTVRETRQEQNGIRVMTRISGGGRNSAEEDYLILPGQVARASGLWADVRFTNALPIIRSPMTPGRKWTWKGTIDRRWAKDWQATAYAVAEVRARENVATPAGNFHAYRVDLTAAVRIEGQRVETATTYWFAPFVGLVRQRGTRVDQSGSEVVVDLKLAEYSLREMLPSKGGSVAPFEQDGET